MQDGRGLKHQEYRGKGHVPLLRLVISGIPDTEPGASESWSAARHQEQSHWHTMRALPGAIAALCGQLEGSMNKTLARPSETIRVGESSRMHAERFAYNYI